MKEKIKLALYSKRLIEYLKDKTPTTEQEYKNFNEQLWIFLCGLKWNEKIRLSNQLTPNLECRSSVNIGNLRVRIYNDLDLDINLMYTSL